jgi:hypothetical protein
MRVFGHNPTPNIAQLASIDRAKAVVIVIGFSSCVRCHVALVFWLVQNTKPSWKRRYH